MRVIGRASVLAASPSTPQQQHDRGFTLVEILINIVILAVLTAGLAQVFAVVTRTLPQAEAQANDARSLTGLSIWVPEDLSSTPSAIDDGTGPGGLLTDASAASGCSGPSPGTNLLRARWSERVGDTTVTYLASYRYVEKGNGFVVQRFACVIGAAPGIVSMTGVLVPSPECAASGGGDDRLVKVVLIGDAKSSAGGASLNVHVGCTVTEIRGISNNPDDELAPPDAATTTTTIAAATTSTSTTTPTSTTSTTTTAVPDATAVIAPPTTTPATTTAETTTTLVTAPTTTLPACASATILAVDPAQANNGTHEDVGELKKDITITVSSIGNCTSLGIMFDPWNADGTTLAHLKWYSLKGVTTITLLGRGGELWSDGTHTIRLLDGVSSTVTLDSDALTVL